MGYRVGSFCFQNESEATDYKMSQVLPTVAADGSLKAPVRKEDGWYFGTSTTTKPRPYPYPGTQTITTHNKITLTHPKCDPLETFKDGLQVGIIISVLFAIAFMFKNSSYFIKRWTKSD